MDSGEEAAAAERSNTTDASPPVARPASSSPAPATEANMASHQHGMSSSRVQMNMQSLHDYIMALSDEDWKSFNDIMINPVTKAQFFKVCSNLAKHVTLSALEIMAPNLARKLGKDPELLVASERTITVFGSSPDNPSVISIEDDEDVIALSNEVLTKITPKAGSRSPLRSCDEPSMSSRSSCGKRSSTSLQSTSSAQDGITKEHVLNSVQSSLTQLNECGLTVGSEEWIDAIAAEIVHTRCQDVKERSHAGMKLIPTMKKALKILACQSPSSNEIPALDASDLGELKVFEEEKLGQNPGNGSSKALERLSSEQLLTQAKKAVSEALTEKVIAVQSTSSARPCCSSVTFLESDISMEQKDLSSGCTPQSVHSVSSMIVGTFVEEITSILELTECVQESHITETEAQYEESSVLLKNLILEGAKGLYDKVQVMMKQFFKNPLILWRKGMSTPDIEKLEAEALQPMDTTSAQYPQLSGGQPTITSSERLLRPTTPLLRKICSDGGFHLTQDQLDGCTKDGLRGVLSSLLYTESEEPCSSSSALSNMFVENIITQIDKLISSKSSITSGSSSDNFSKYSLENLRRISDSKSSQSSSSLVCLQRKLSSEVFQTNALRTVSEAVLKTLRSHNSGSLDQHCLSERAQVSSFFLPVDTAVSDIESLELDTAYVDADSAADVLPGAVFSEMHAEAPPVRLFYIDMDDAPEKERSPISSESIISIVNTVSAELDCSPLVSLGEAREMSASEGIVTGSSYPLLTPVDSLSEDNNSLISMLVLRLLSELKDQEPLTDDMLEISRVLINRVTTEIDAALGTLSKACPHGVRVRKVFRALYKDLILEFGNKEILLRALMSGDPCVEKTLVISLTREFTQSWDMPKLKEEKTKKRTLRFLPKISKIKAFLETKLKRRTSDVNKNEQSTKGQNSDLTSNHIDLTSHCGGCLPCVAPLTSRKQCTTPTSSEKKPRKGFISKIISRLSKKSSKTCPETLD